VLRRATDRVATARGIAFIGLAVPLVVVAFARAWFSPPFVDVPSPAWMVAVPTLDLASATCAIASIIVLLLALGTRRDTR
jgi:hypothetical protein